MPQMSLKIRNAILAAGVKNLKEFGYPEVTPTNILTDAIYKEFFKSMLNDNLGKGYDSVINELLAEVSK